MKLNNFTRSWFGARHLFVAAACAAALGAQAQTITMASTPSTEQSGLFAHLLPAFK